MKFSTVMLIVVLSVSVFGLISSISYPGTPVLIVDKYSKPVSTVNDYGNFYGFYYSSTSMNTTIKLASFTMPAYPNSTMTVHIRGTDYVLFNGDSMFITDIIYSTYRTIQSAWLIVTFAVIILCLAIFVITRERETSQAKPAPQVDSNFQGG